MVIPRIPRSDRGFVTYGANPITCKYGTIEVYESSAVDPHVWLALRQDPKWLNMRGPGEVYAHLAPAEVVELVRRLGAWLSDGGFAEITVTGPAP